MAYIIKQIIKLYQSFSRLYFPQSCRYHPSCSQYALQAIEKYGVVNGGALALARILRCSPLFKGGSDPLK